MNHKIIALVFLAVFLFGCAQQEKTGYSEQDNPFVQRIEPFLEPNLDNFELEFTSVGKASMITVLFQKNNVTQITEMPDKVLELKSKNISEQEFADLARIVQQNRFFNFTQQEYGEFSDNDGPAYVLEAKLDGEKNIVSCQLDCPQELKNIRQTIEKYVE